MKLQKLYWVLIVSIGVILFSMLGCATASIEEGKTTARVFGKAEVEVACTTNETGDETCTVTTKGDGLTENAVGLIGKVLELPGQIIRGAGNSLP